MGYLLFLGGDIKLIVGKAACSSDWNLKQYGGIWHLRTSSFSDFDLVINYVVKCENISEK